MQGPVISLVAPRRELSRRERKAEREAQKAPGVSMHEADEQLRAFGGTVTVQEKITLEEIRDAHVALRQFLEHPFHGHGGDYMTLPKAFKRHMAVGYACINAFLSDGKLTVNND